MDDPRESSRPGPGGEGTDRMPARIPAPPFWAEAHAALGKIQVPLCTLAISSYIRNEDIWLHPTRQPIAGAERGGRAWPHPLIPCANPPG